MNHSPSKKVHPAPELDSPSKSTPSTPTIVVVLDSDNKLSSVGDIPYHDMRKPFVISRSINEDSFKCLNISPHYPKLAYIPGREEVSELLRDIIFFFYRKLTSNTGHGGTIFDHVMNFD